MATSVHPVAADRATGPLALWHLLSLDAPTVAAVWTWFIARANHVSLPLTSTIAMAVAVWMLYAADRLLDVRLLNGQRGLSLHVEGLEARHLFHHRHRAGFLSGIGASAVVLAVLLPRLDGAAVKLYLVEGALLFAWFLILHATGSGHRLPKEIAVGLFFAAATFIPTVARRPDLRLALLPDALVFAALCSLNCLYIYGWEHETERHGAPAGLQAPSAHVTTRFALRHLRSLVTVTIALCVVVTGADHAAPKAIAAACGLAVALLLGLDRSRHLLSSVTLRAAADLMLLTPFLLLPLLR